MSTCVVCHISLFFLSLTELLLLVVVVFVLVGLFLRERGREGGAKLWVWALPSFSFFLPNFERREMKERVLN